MSAKTYLIRPDLRLVRAGTDCAYLLGEPERICLSGKKYPLLLSLLDGVRTDEEIAQEVSSVIDPVETYYSLLSLKDKGLIQLFGECEPGYEAGTLPESAVSRPVQSSPESRFLLISGSEGERAAMRKAIREIPIPGASPDANRTIALLLCPDYCLPSVSRLAAGVLAEDQICIPVRLGGKAAWFGPMIGHPQAPCFECLLFQINRNRPVESHLISKGFEHDLLIPPAIGSLLTLEKAARSVVKHIDAERLSAEVTERSTLYRFDKATGSVERHVIRKRQQCPACGDGNAFRLSAKRRITIDMHPRQEEAQKGNRVRRSDETWERLKDLVDPIAGIVNRIEPVPSWDQNLGSVYRAGYFVCPPLDEVDTGENFIRFSYGKGKTAKQAETSALCEAIERYAAVFQGDEPIIRGRFPELSPHAIDPQALLNLSENQYRARKDGPGRQCRYSVPAPFHTDMVLDWTYAWSLTYDQPRLIPATHGYAFYPAPETEIVCPFNSNGNAAGNSLEEAVLQGFLEVVERDAVALWWYNRIPRPEIDIRCFSDPYFDAVRKHYAGLGWKHWILDLTHDFGIPVAASLALNQDTSGYIIGFGCHPDPHLAVQRATTEMNQVYDAAGKGLWKESEFESTGFLHPDRSAAPYAAERFSKPPSRTYGEEAANCVAIARSLGLETIVQDYSRPDIDLRTVKVIVPGMRHFWRRLGPGRLYDVPVKLGWIPQKFGENELNPIPLEI